MYCPKCGKEIPEQAAFCPGCGSAVTADGTPKKGGKKGRGKLFLIAAGLAAAVLFLPSMLAGLPDDSRDIPVQEEETDDPVLTQDAKDDLLDIIARSNESCLTMFQDIDEAFQDEEELSDAAYIEKISQALRILDDFSADLDGLRNEANAVSGLDRRMKYARNEYFNLLRDGTAAHHEAILFIVDYLTLYDRILTNRPLAVDYDTPSEYAQALSQWTQESRESYAAVSCPVCVQSEWKQYGKILGYNESIAEKFRQADKYNDWLRYYSAEYMNARYLTVEENQEEKLLGCYQDESSHAFRQYNAAVDLYREMLDYAQLEQEDTEGYEFENICSGEVLLDYEAVDTIYPSLYSTYDAFVIIKTGCISGTASIVVEAEVEGFTQKYKESFNLDASHRRIYIKPPALTGNLALTTAKPAQLKVTVSRKDGSLIEAKVFPIDLKSKYDFSWYTADYGISTQDNILCFLTPESSAIAALKRQAIDEITAISGNRVESFAGYQSITPTEYATTYLQTASLMSALYKMGVRYSMDPYTTSNEGQHILLPEEVIKQKGGLCIETSLVIASALQSANMHAFLLLPPGHAQVAVEVWNSGAHRGEYFLIETTDLKSAVNNTKLFMDNFERVLDGYVPDKNTPITYMNSNQWLSYLSDTFPTDPYVIDCSDSKLLGITPFAN